jgi:hypothetical protein
MRAIVLGASIVTAALVAVAIAVVGTSTLSTAHAEPVSYSVPSSAATARPAGPVYLSLGDSA